MKSVVNCCSSIYPGCLCYVTEMHTDYFIVCPIEGLREALIFILDCFYLINAITRKVYHSNLKHSSVNHLCETLAVQRCMLSGRRAHNCFS